MSAIQQTGSIAIGDAPTVPLPWNLNGETLHLTIDDREFAIESDSDLRSQVCAFIDGLSRSRKALITVQCCISCQHLQLSGMALDMGRGQRGVCLKHKAGVEIMQSCGSHLPLVQ
jgi:hypothetical protein